MNKNREMVSLDDIALMPLAKGEGMQKQQRVFHGSSEVLGVLRS